MRKNVKGLRLRAGRGIRALRKRRGWSQEALAERVQTTEKHVGQLERGQFNVGIDLLGRVADAFGVDVTELFGGGASNDTGGAVTYTLTKHEFECVAEALQIVTRVRDTRAPTEPTN
jgi:transcriptional regulator with XRE-family HTH domain